jgi:hypothetical protein
MYENEQLAGLINKDLGSPEEGIMIPVSNLDRNMIREKLAILIGQMMQNNFEKLCQTMYRLDVPEPKFHQVLTESTAGDIPYLLADLVIERELQKVRTRMMFKRKQL